MSDLNVAAIGNCRIGALVDQSGRINWWCLPRPDGDPIFCSLLRDDDADGGFFDVFVQDAVATSQAYNNNTAILTTTITDAQGAAVRITDFAPRFWQHRRIFRPTMLVRRIEPVAGIPSIRVRLRPSFAHGTIAPQRTLGSNHIRYVSSEMALRLTTDAPVSYVVNESSFLLSAPAHFVLGADERLDAPIAESVRQFLELTEEYWLEWVRYLSVPFEWQDAVIRAAITLKLCSFEETGAIVAALTTSIPEAPNSARNWDYRFCWPRDAFFTVQALNRLGATRTMEDYIRFVTNVAALSRDGVLKPVHSVLPEELLPERELAELTGYRGMGPVRIGNAAREQAQNDGYGSVILAAAQMFYDRRLPRQGDVSLYRRLERLGRVAAERAFQPDAGLWEYRGRAQVHTFSSAMCWAACDRLGKIARLLGLPDEAKGWRAEAKRIRAGILERGFNAKLGSFTEAFDGETVDASLLLLHEIGFVSADDPRYLGTIRIVERDLRRGRLLLRYATADDFGVPTTAFTTCTFWYVDALAATGRREEAREIFEYLLECRNHVGLLSEDIDMRSNELWGNIPQTYCMVGLILSAMRLSQTWESAFWRGS